MVRTAVVSALLVVSLQAAFGQVINHGVPASVVSVGPGGRPAGGPPASALSPTPPPFAIRPPHRAFVGISNGKPTHFGTSHSRHGFANVVPVFYPLYPAYGYGYGNGYDNSVADPNVDQPADPAAGSGAPADSSASSDDSVARSEAALKLAYLQGQRDAMARELEEVRQAKQQARATTPASPTKDQSQDQAAPSEDTAPLTVFIFKDGHQIETRNFAIMGQTLYDISNGGVKKIQLADLDSTATIKANDERGIVVKLP
jgi:hypothetical protein